MALRSLLDIGGVLVDPTAQLRDLNRVDREDSLYEFLRGAWPYIDPSPWKDGWPIEAVAEHLEAVIDGKIKRLLINLPPRLGKSSVCSVALPAWTWAQEHHSPTSGPGVQFLHASYAQSLSLRDSVKCRRLIESPWYQKQWGDRFKLTTDQNTKGRFSNDQGGERLITSVGAGVTGEGCSVGVIDDANAANEAFSEASIHATIEWWDGTISTRLNDPKTGAYIVIQQRLAEDDLSGHILSKDIGEWTHLMLPMHYEPERSFHTSIGWKDPRTERGQLLWPERFGEEEVKTLERALGPFKCNPAEAPILMADLSLKPISEIKVGDEIIGFAKKVRTDGKKGRFRLERTTVTEVHIRVAPVVKMTLDSGETIRCTRDHKWYVGKDRGEARELYRPVTLGRTSLSRICPPRLPELTPDEQRLAGWLSGFFDGEGTVSLCRQNGNGDFRSTASVLFYQGSGRNLPLCEKLERGLNHFGFPFSYREDERKPNKDAPCYGYRSYRLKSPWLETFQRFMHIVQPTKWRDRIIEGAYGAKFIQSREKVLSIEEDGIEPVYGLTTGTGNYVAWGLASSNSAGQLEQRPEPQGGGIIKREWWQPWDEQSFPPMDYIVAYVDTAYTEKTINDPSAMIVWGVFSQDPIAQVSQIMNGAGRVMQARAYTETIPKVMMMHAWTERLEFHALTEKVAATARKFKCDRVLIENKASGISVAQELQRVYGHEDFGVELNDPKSQDKTSRLYSVQHLFSDGMIYAPDRSWADMVITQVGVFPGGKNDDLVDCCSGGIKHLRDIGVLVRSIEKMAEIEDAKMFTGRPPAPLYPS